MPEDTLLNSEDPSSRVRALGMQSKLHRWATADPGRRFDDLFNLVHDPATLTMAFARVAGHQGARTPGVDGLTVIEVEERTGRDPGTALRAYSANRGQPCSRGDPMLWSGPWAGLCSGSVAEAVEAARDAGPLCAGLAGARVVQGAAAGPP